MHLHLSVVGLLAALAAAVPVEKSAGRPALVEGETLRLIKTSPEDLISVTEKELEENYIEKNIKFIDVTNVDASELAILSTPSDADVSKLVSRQSPTYPTTLSHQTETNRLIGTASVAGPQSHLRTITGFTNRHYQSASGVEAATWLFNQAKSLAAPNPSITVQQFNHSFRQPSLIVKIPGELNSSVIVGAHFDGVGSGSTRREAADDDGSGSVVILEALRVLAAANFKPKQTLEFMWFSGEEQGLLGSRDVFSSYRSRGARVLAYLNQDMAGYSPSKTVSVYTDYVDTSLTAYVRLIAATYTGSTPTTSRCGYGCSDHASARSNGFPAAFVVEDVFEKTSPYIHTAQDTYSTIQWDSILRHIKLTIGYLVEASYL
ncbi:hypothetical protein MAPG_08492 [Magnaporthiopsis poae ATCC 64411]|uniref:Peptide hydrolase n=1 Tax=Magnaporthiopsis poae (strain ATCC 64411 / 73-15) TaxID=644358 RepID=A0A0C4E7H9_MAGP6|nr:hypothetical protein MAPG_08492 [Magnaporthiopsis poae ATCC 64411]